MKDKIKKQTSQKINIVRKIHPNNEKLEIVEVTMDGNNYSFIVEAGATEDIIMKKFQDLKDIVSRLTK